MTGVPPGARYEVKFVAREIDVAVIRRWLRTHPAGFSTAYPDRRVNNIYFDTFEYEGVDEKLAGVSARAKVRYRWYGDSALPAAGVLEVKCRRNAFGWKLSFPVREAPRGVTWRELVAAIARQLPPESRAWLRDRPVPVLINRYDRSYFETADRRVRATIDTRLEAADQRLRATPNVAAVDVRAGVAVLELKFAREVHGIAARILADVPVRVSAHSKYALAALRLAEG